MAKLAFFFLLGGALAALGFFVGVRNLAAPAQVESAAPGHEQLNLLDARVRFIENTLAGLAARIVQLEQRVEPPKPTELAQLRSDLALMSLSLAKASAESTPAPAPPEPQESQEPPGDPLTRFAQEARLTPEQAEEVRQRLMAEKALAEAMRARSKRPRQARRELRLLQSRNDRALQAMLGSETAGEIAKLRRTNEKTRGR